MALIFSHITLHTDYGERQFFAGGIPEDAHDLELYTAYHEFVEEITEDTLISVHVDTYRYGEGKDFEANPPEIAYFTLRQRDDPAFLLRCPKIAESTFQIDYRPGELFEPNL